MVDRATPAAERHLRFRVRSPGGDAVAEATAALRTNSDRPAVIRVALPNPTPTLRQLSGEGQIDVPGAVLRTLEETHGIRSFSDIRRRGGIGGLAGSETLDPAVVSRLDALADLDRLSSNMVETTLLIERHFASVLAIAEAPRRDFVAASAGHGGRIDEQRAGELHIAARAQSDLLTQMYLGAAADHARAPSRRREPGNELDPLAPFCGCDDCEAAVSPGAYLATLLDYVLKHVKNASAAIDLPFLDAAVASALRRPTDRLRGDGAAGPPGQARRRGAAELVVGQRPLFEAGREAELAKAEADYRLAAYARLLTLLGTSYEELRRARSAAPDVRAALAGRLGISLTTDASVPRADELNRLLLNPGLPAGDPRSLTEQTLERLFGLADSTRDRLSEGVKYGDMQGQIRRWNLNGADWNVNTDVAGLVHLSFYRLAANSFAVFAYRDAARTQSISGGESKTPSGAIRLVSDNGSRLSGTVEIAYLADTTVVSISAVPEVLIWRLRLHSDWAAEDWPAAAAAAEGTPPLIDPDVTGFGDLRSARPGQAAFDLLLARLNGMTTERAAMKTARETAADPLVGMEAIIAQALSTSARAVTVADLDALAAAHRQGERIEQRLSALRLAPGAFLFLMSMLAVLRSGDPLGLEEWDIVYDTLLQARKQLGYPVWRIEEQRAGLILSPSAFRLGGDASAPERTRSLAIPLWLSTREARRRWLDVIEARAAQQAAVTGALESALGSAEETTLPLLRSALIAASDAAGTRWQNAPSG